MLPREFEEEVNSGDRLRALVALRETLAHAISASSDGKELAALALRLTRVLDQIAELGPADEEDNDLAERRRRKLSAAAGS